ncbi:PAP/OAS1 substrate-binding domain superfamily [Abeliophyllum distichum]|uniref:PAP/OAS1 substrate-binding domain superfamily n=1 Tax=Abeliophyllum distichum TaxID=126358 RepID=A0ABD1RCV0_9LAMI
MSMSDSEAVDQNDGDFAADGDMIFSYGSRRKPPPNPAAINAECWAAADEAAQQVVNCIHPTLNSEKERKEVIDYVRRLFKHGLDCEVFPYGSVPLKTYLPFGDIDLTTLRSPNIQGSLAHDVIDLLQGEEQNENAEYEVKETQFIDAEVKIVKCIVRGMVTDISFNQLGGLHTLCFLEQVDCLVGKNHLFKRSIILVKAWCYYESRTLGAHRGLISTYALETLVLYIFHLFNSSLNGPLEVLYRFLECFGQFDWETYCISLQGPVCISSLPDIVVEMPENGPTNLMLSEEFLKNCKELFSFPSRGGLETKPKAFQRKHLNIIDPLKENNNLGRSVNKGNFYRIRSAFKYGAQKLGQVLLQPRDKVADGVSEFFKNTLTRHGHKYGSNIRHCALTFGDIKASGASSNLNDNRVENLSHALREMGLTGTGGDSEALNPLADLAGDYDSHIRCLQYAQLCQGFALSTPALSDPPPSPSWIQNENPQDTVSLSLPPGQNQFLRVNLNSVFVEPPMHPASDSALPTMAFGSEGTMQYAQRCQGFASPTPALSIPPPSPSRIQNKKPQDPVLSVPPPLPSRNQNKKPQDSGSRSMPHGENRFSHVNLNPEFVEPSMHPAADSALPAFTFGSEGTMRNARRNTCFPDMSRRNELTPTSLRSNNSMNDTCEVRQAQSRIRGRRSDSRSESPRSVGDDNHSNDSSSSSYRIEFGTIGDLAEDLISDPSLSWGSTRGFSQEAQGSKAVPKKER